MMKAAKLAALGRSGPTYLAAASISSWKGSRYPSENALAANRKSRLANRKVGLRNLLVNPNPPLFIVIYGAHGPSFDGALLSDNYSFVLESFL
jgi:hypothetical protein